MPQIQLYDLQLLTKKGLSAHVRFQYTRRAFLDLILMQSVRRAVIVGDITGGGHPVEPVAVAQGFGADIPFARSLNPYTHADWEGTGGLFRIFPSLPLKPSKRRRQPSWANVL
jgi:hypothetical protein